MNRQDKHKTAAISNSNCRSEASMHRFGHSIHIKEGKSLFEVRSELH